MEFGTRRRSARTGGRGLCDGGLDPAFQKLGGYRLLSSLRESNERREYEIRLMRSYSDNDLPTDAPLEFVSAIRRTGSSSISLGGGISEPGSPAADFLAALFTAEQQPHLVLPTVFELVSIDNRANGSSSSLGGGGGLGRKWLLQRHRQR